MKKSKRARPSVFRIDILSSLRFKVLRANKPSARSYLIQYPGRDRGKAGRLKQSNSSIGWRFGRGWPDFSEGRSTRRRLANSLVGPAVRAPSSRTRTDKER